MKTLRQHRISRLLTIRGLAKLAGVSTQTVVSAETGKPVRLRTMAKLAEALNVDAEDIEEFAANMRREVERAKQNGGH